MNDLATNYAAAVDHASAWLGRHMTGLLSGQYETEPREFIYVFGLEIFPAWDDHTYCKQHYPVSDGVLEFLVVRSESDRGAYELFKRITISRLFRQERLHPAMMFFTGKILAGVDKPPKGKTRKSTASFAANLHLVYLVRYLSETYKLTLTRNDEAVFKMSSCDAVSEALQRIGHHRTWRAVKDLLMHKSSQEVREVADELEKFRNRQTSES